MVKPHGKPLSLQQRAFLLGYKKGLNFARSEMREIAKAFDQKLAELASDYEVMIRTMKREQQRYNDIDAALKARPGPDDIWLQ
jgi:hypothetical protein